MNCPGCDGITLSKDPTGKAEYYCSRAGCGWEGNKPVTDADRIARLERNLETARRALRPFAFVADYFEQFNPGFPNDHIIYKYRTLTLGHLREARAALEDQPYVGEEYK